MAKPLTLESLKTKPKFELTLDKETHEKLIMYLLLTKKATERNEFINSLIKDRLKDKILTNDLLDFREEPFYFNKNELLKNKTVKATKNLTSHNLDEIFVVHFIPNYLDDFNADLETYCVGNNPNMHKGYFILPKYKDHEETHFSFLYDSEKGELEIGLENPNNIDFAFNPLDDDKQKIKEYLIARAKIDTIKLENDELNVNEFLFNYNIMYPYSLNLELHKLKKKVDDGEELTEAQKQWWQNILFEGIYLE